MNVSSRGHYWASFPGATLLLLVSLLQHPISQGQRMTTLMNSFVLHCRKAAIKRNYWINEQIPPPFFPELTKQNPNFINFIIFKFCHLSLTLMLGSSTRGWELEVPVQYLCCSQDCALLRHLSWAVLEPVTQSVFHLYLYTYKLVTS